MSEDITCPTCNRGSFESRRAMKIHHTKIHGEPANIDKLTEECPTCGELFETERAMKCHHSAKHNQSIAGVKVSCHYCGESFRTPYYKVENSERLFCDIECRSSWMSETFTGENNHQYNSREFECEFCGEKFNRAPSQVREHKLCSKTCSSKWKSEAWRGENHPLYKNGTAEGFTEHERTQIYERDGYTCQQCGQVGGQLNAHHIVPVHKNEEKEHDIDNGVTLCVECHAEKHPEIEELILAQKD